MSTGLKRFSFLSGVGLMALSSFGCATVEPLKGPDGSPHYLIQCSDIRLCYEKALQTCQGPYEIVNSTSRVQGAPQGLTVSEQQLLIKCKAQEELP